jgi:hypothetical protein
MANTKILVYFPGHSIDVQLFYLFSKCKNIFKRMLIFTKHLKETLIQIQ